jgi:hypothetical protein
MSVRWFYRIEDKKNALVCVFGKHTEIHAENQLKMEWSGRTGKKERPRAGQAQGD